MRAAPSVRGNGHSTQGSIVNVIFAGTPEFAALALDRIVASTHRVCAVYTQPDRPAGRGQRVQESAVKQRAREADLPVFQPEKLRGNEAAWEQLRRHAADIMVVVAYGLILPAAVLAIPPRGCINIHASMLPRWRGAAPIQRAILAGDRQTGITIIQMDEGLDTGRMLAKAPCAIADDDTGSSLHDKLAVLGATTVVSVLDQLESGAIEGEAQDNAHACYAAKLDKSETWVDWSSAAVAIARKIRAFNAWPVARTQWQGQPLLLWTARSIDAEAFSVPGTVVALGSNGIDVATGSGIVRIMELQLAGKRRMTAGEFLNSGALRQGDRFDAA